MARVYDTAHETIKVSDVSNFAWFDERAEAIKKAKELGKLGIDAKIGGKRAKSWANYHDIKTAAIYQNKWSGSGMPWVVAW